MLGLRPFSKYGLTKGSHHLPPSDPSAWCELSKERSWGFSGQGCCYCCGEGSTQFRDHGVQHAGRNVLPAKATQSLPVWLWHLLSVPKVPQGFLFPFFTKTATWAQTVYCANACGGEGLTQERWHLWAVWERDSVQEHWWLSLQPSSKPQKPIFPCMSSVPSKSPFLCWRPGWVAVREFVVAH